MKKLVLTIAIVLGLGISAFAQGGLFGKGETSGSSRDEGTSLLGSKPGFPGHGSEDDNPAPLGSGAFLLIGFGAAYALKKRKED